MKYEVTEYETRFGTRYGICQVGQIGSHYAIIHGERVPGDEADREVVQVVVDRLNAKGKP